MKKNKKVQRKRRYWDFEEEELRRYKERENSNTFPLFYNVCKTEGPLNIIGRSNVMPKQVKKKPNNKI